VIKGPDYVNDDMDPEDDHSHGNFFEESCKRGTKLLN
jgi:hypothetical protein